MNHPIPTPAEKEAVWKAYADGKPTRTPVRWGMNNRVWLLNPSQNTFGWTYEDYLHNPNVILETNARFQAYVREEIYPTTCDQSSAFPEHWECSADVQNCYDAAFYGGKLVARPGQVPAVEPFLTLNDVDDFLKRDDASENAIENNPFLKDRFALTEAMKQAARNFTFKGRSIKVHDFTLNFDGPITAGAAIFGADFFLLLAMDPDKAQQLIEKFTRDAVARVRYLRRRAGHPERVDHAGFADDSIQLLSREMYQKMVLPWHLFFCNETSLSTPSERKRKCHLCGDATRHFKTIRDTVGIDTFDTGFPVDHAALRRELGPDTEISGGVHITLLLEGTPNACYNEAERILNSGIRDGGKFTLRDANNLPPNVPLENLQAVYQACLTHGTFQ